MSHEPECATASCMCSDNEDCMECVCVCDALRERERKGYQRGREDGRDEAGERVVRFLSGLDFDGIDGDYVIAGAIAAARGKSAADEA